jgi:hypothetical protein
LDGAVSGVGIVDAFATELEREGARQPSEAALAHGTRGVFALGRQSSQPPRSPFDPNGPFTRVHRLPHTEVEIDFHLRCLPTGWEWIAKARLKRSFIEQSYVETETAEEIGKGLRLRRTADLNIDRAKLLLAPPHLRPPFEVWDSLDAGQGWSGLAVRRGR